MQNLKQQYPEIYAAIRDETRRQTETLEMIASENFVSLPVLEALGSVMTNKYAEGYPRHRYYGGCEHVDVVEGKARFNVKKLFNAKYANVQPHSGSQANMAAYLTLAKPGDTIMGMHLNHGGHLTHGSPVNFSGRLFNVVAYTISPDTGRIDYDEMAKLAREHKPRFIVSGASAYPRIIEFDRIKEICDDVGCYHIADIAHIAGLVATGLHPDPLPYTDIVTSTTHKTLRGPRGGLILTNVEGGELMLPNMPKPKTMPEAIDAWVFPGCQGGPLMHVIAAKAVAFIEARKPEFKEYQQQVIKNAAVLAETLLAEDFKLVTGGTDNHLILMDLAPRGLTGRASERALENAGITTNKNMVPNDPQKPFITSGIRLGTPALTTRGMKEDEMRRIGKMISYVLSDLEDEERQKKTRSEVEELCKRFKFYEIPPE
ncbi:MAG: serine hydroxymethyltransferase [Candidatus Hatepunaea meridiana]|nr:serine hydroxymethyltransferase [Candidatus Hatepunaea meridiana]